MKEFNDINFLLDNDYGKKLYHDVATALPVIDYHNHLNAGVIAANKPFANLYQLWVQHDPYKHRAMRICGIAEDLITGDGDDYEKYAAWAGCFQNTIGNPLFHWSCMELQELFGIAEILTPANAKAIWEKANACLAEAAYLPQQLLQRFGVELLCTSDDLLDSLEHHISLRDKGGIVCLPSLRSDSIIAFNTPAFFGWLDHLQQLTAVEINDLETYKQAIINRLDLFDTNGCLLADHSLDGGFTFMPTADATATELFTRLLQRDVLTSEEHIQLQSHVLQFLGEAYCQRKWILQLHIGAHRYTSTRLRKRVGPAGGYACIGTTVGVDSIAAYLDELDKTEHLPKTILYTLNPADNAVFASLTGSYSGDGVQGKIQFGPAWWYNDHYEGIMQQLTALSSYGLLSTAIGMTTDSRSLLSMIRHAYYRRILCNYLGANVEAGKMPDDWEFLSTLVRNISYNNSKNWIQKSI